MTAPIDDQCRARQPREREVRCLCGRSTWNHSAVCNHCTAKNTATPPPAGVAAAGLSNPAGRHDHPHPVVSAHFSQAPAGLGGDRHPAAGSPGQHGPAAVLANSAP